MEMMKTFEQDIKKYRDKQYIEIEIRLGKINRNIFDTNVGKHAFDRVLAGLDQFTGWESKTKIEDEVYYWGNGVRCVYTDSDCVYEKKNKILKNDLSLENKFDVRLGISQEIPCEMPTDDANRCVSRGRFSFLRKNVRIDMTIVKGPPKDKDSEESISYQIELEILSAKTDQEIFSALNKVHDILKLV